MTNVVLEPGRYYLVQQSGNANGSNALPAPDASGTTALNATAGKVALVSTTVALNGACPTSAGIVDMVGYGTSANCFEGHGRAPAPSTANADMRAASGCQDTDDNAADFNAAPPAPRNSASPRNLCASAFAPPPTWEGILFGLKQTVEAALSVF